MHAPPPPPIQKKPIPWLPILLILGVGFAIVAGLCGFGFYAVSQMVKEPPKAKEGAGKPVVRKELPNDWARYHFPEGPFDVDLPGEPEFSDPGFERVHALSIRDWTYYEFGSEHASLVLSVYTYRSRDFADPKDEVLELKRSLEGDSAVKNLKVKDYPKKVGGTSGHEVECRYENQGEPLILKAFAWQEGKTVYYLQTYHYPEEDKAATADLDRIIQSFKSGNS